MIRNLRLALLLLLGAACPLLVQTATASVFPSPADQALARDMLQELISINTTHPQGTMKASLAIIARLEAAGFKGGDLQLLAPSDHPAWSNVVVRLKGNGKARPVLYEGHIDVVEAKPEDWSLPPFQLTEKDGWFYGRGTLDMKGDDVAILMGLIRLKREGFVADRDIIIMLTADEEGGDANGADFLLKQHRDLVNAEFAVNVDAGGGGLRAGQRIDFRVQTSEKTYVTYQLEVTNPGGHSSRPGKENAIYRLAEGLVKLSHLQFPLRVNATTRGYFAAMAQEETGQVRADLLAVAAALPDPGAAARLSENPRWNAQLHTTCIATMLQGGHAENALPQRATATLQCRMMPGDRSEDVQALLVQTLADPKIHVTVINPARLSPESPPTPTLMKIVDQVVQATWPGVPIHPVMEAGASDSIYSRQAGIPTYGLSGMFTDLDDNRAHGRDERVSVQAFYEDVEFSYRLMKALSRAN